jgi:hypothetical protein
LAVSSTASTTAFGLLCPLDSGRREELDFEFDLLEFDFGLLGERRFGLLALLPERERRLAFGLEFDFGERRLLRFDLEVAALVCAISLSSLVLR